MYLHSLVESKRNYSHNFSLLQPRILVKICQISLLIRKLKIIIIYELGISILYKKKQLLTKNFQPNVPYTLFQCWTFNQEHHKTINHTKRKYGNFDVVQPHMPTSRNERVSIIPKINYKR